MSRRRAERSVLPTRDQWWDAAFLVVGSATALLGLGSTYPGWSFLVVGMAGLLLAMVIAHLTHVSRLPGVAAVAGAIVAFFLLGPVLCLRAEGYVLPGPGAWSALTDQVVFGWKDLLTTLPPIDGRGPLLVLPFVLGLSTGLLGTLGARVQAGPAWLRVVLPVFAPLLLLAAVILLGLRQPHHLMLSGGLTAAAALGWLILRSHRTQTQVRGGAGRLSRLAAGGAILALAAGAASPVATWATGGDDKGRVVLRTYVEPPFDVGQYPSPLAGFRTYVKYPSNPPKSNVYDRELLTVQGMPAGRRLRFAVLDNYDGVVWGASNQALPGVDNDTYQRVGPSLDNDTDGEEIEAKVVLGEAYKGVWLPLAGNLQDIDFETQADLHSQEFRYNLEAAGGVMPTGLRPGDAYTFTSVIPADDVTEKEQPSAVLSSAGMDQPWLVEAADKLSDPAAPPMQRVFQIANKLHSQGKYSDGVAGREVIYTPGHYVERLGRGFLNATQIVGNAEQYSAAMALLANSVGVPARVVLGAVVPEGGQVKGADVTAWVELRVADGSWRTLSTETYMSRQKPADEQTKKKQQQSGVVIPPPAQVPPPSTMGEQTDTEITPRVIKQAEKKKAIATMPSWLRAILLYAGGPLLGIALLLAMIVGLKVLRRRRRRTAGATSSRIVSGWRELTDHARDLGVAVPTRGVTRSEQAALLPSGGASALARRTDLVVFAPTAPDSDAVTAYWAEVAAERRALSEGASRLRRWRAVVDPRTLFRR
ncbi:MAG: transglutaminase-like domain-containing protein [Nocardioides sp.]|jgi:transglutaminase-like putative cysteine protease